MESGRAGENNFNAKEAPVQSFDSAWVESEGSSGKDSPTEDDEKTLLAYTYWKSPAARKEYLDRDSVRCYLRGFGIGPGWQDVESAGPQHDYELFLKSQGPLGYQVRFLMVKQVSSWALEEKRARVTCGCVAS